MTFSQHDNYDFVQYFTANLSIGVVQKPIKIACEQMRKTRKIKHANKNRNKMKK